jgi:hypothetical protein
MRSYLSLLALMSAVVLLGSATRSATITGTVKGVDGALFKGHSLGLRTRRPRLRSTCCQMGMDAQGYIWYSSHHQYTLGRVDPQTGMVTKYAFPHSENDIKEIMVDSQGRMWYGSAPNNKVGYFYLSQGAK